MISDTNLSAIDMSYNHQLFFLLSDLAHHSVVFDGVIKFCAIYLPYLVVISAIIFVLYHQHGTGNEPVFQMVKIHIKEFLILACSILFTWGFITLLKELIGAPRPYLVFQNFASLFPYGAYDSFPSGHAGLFGAIAGAIYIFHRRAGITICALVIGLSRIIAGVHFPLDIITGLIIGFFGVQLVYRLFKKYHCK
jgi:undecaprenyl-diphosphatase